MTVEHFYKGKTYNLKALDDFLSVYKDGHVSIVMFDRRFDCFCMVFDFNNRHSIPIKTKEDFMQLEVAPHETIKRLFYEGIIRARQDIYKT
jgi:hypothetical protein